MIEVSNLSVTIGSEHILRNISFNLSRGETLALVGANGAGKSTLVKSLMGLIPHSGTVKFNGQLRNDYSSKELARQLSYVPQSLTSIPPYTVVEFISLSLYSHRSFFGPIEQSVSSRIDKVLTLTGCEQYRERLFTSLSGGERQKVLIAAALVQSSSIVLLDEPAAHLDPAQQQELYDLIRSLSSSSELTTIVVTHDVNIVADIADKVIGLKQGEVHCSGTSTEVLTAETLSALYDTQFRAIEENLGRTYFLPLGGRDGN